MAYGTRYQSSFYNYFGKLVTVKINKRDYSDSIEDDIRISEVTIQSNYQDDNTPIIGKGAKVVIIAESEDMSYLNDLLISYERQFECVIEYDGSVVFRGYSICDLNERQFLPFSAVTIEFTDYMRRLDGKYPDRLKTKGGLSSVFDLMDEMIGLTTLDLPLYVNSTLFEDNMTSAATDTFLAQTYVQNANFYTNTYEYDNIYDVVNKTLQPFSAFIYSYNDKWVVERQEDITRTGNWVYYSGGVPAATGSLKQEIYKQGSEGETFEYVDMSQVIEYDSGLHTLILALHDKIKDTLVYNDFTTDMLTTAETAPIAGTLDKNVWYRHEDITNLAVGAKLRGIEQYIKWDASTEDTGLYYNFEMQFNIESDETTELTVNFNMSADVDMTTINFVFLRFYLRVDGGDKSDYWMYQELDTSYVSLTDAQNYTLIRFSTEDLKNNQWSASMSFNLTDTFATRGGLTSIWELLGSPTRQRFTLMIMPVLAGPLPNMATFVTTNYLGDIAVTVNEAEIDNKIEYHLNESFVKTDEIDLYLFDLDNVNYSNGLLGSDQETLTNLWTSENSTVACPLYEVFAKCKFRKYGRTIHRLKGKILIDEVLKPFALIKDDNITNESAEVMTFLLNGFTWDLDRGTYDIEAEEYTEEEIIVDGVTYDSSGNPEEGGGVPSAPQALTLNQLTHRGVIWADWNPVGGVIGYKLQRKPYYSGGSWVDAYTFVYTGTNELYQDPIVSEGDPTGVTFTYRVLAYNSYGDGAYSTEETLAWT